MTGKSDERAIKEQTETADDKRNRKNRKGKIYQTGSTIYLNTTLLKTRFLKCFVSRTMAKMAKAQANRHRFSLKPALQEWTLEHH